MNALSVFLVGLVVKGSGVLLLGFLAARCLRARSASHRSLAWLAVFSVMAVLPLGGLVDPIWSLPVVTVRQSVPMAMPPDRHTTRSPQTKGDVFADEPAEALPPTVAWDARLISAAIYLAGGAFVLALRLAGSWQLRSIQRRGRKAGEKLEVLVRQLSAERGVKRALSVLISERVSVPMTWGVLRPVIALPPVAEEWSTTELRTALRHEIAHIAHHDAARRWLATVVCAVWWPHPLAWLAAKAWRLQQEQACDDAVLRCGADAHDYAAQLLQAAKTARLGHLQSAAALVMAMPSGLESRLRSVVDQQTSRSEARTLARFTALAFAATACAACLLVGAQAADAIADSRFIHVRSKFIEIADDSAAMNDPEVKRWLTGKPAVLTDSEMEQLMRNLAQKKGVDIMTAPSVTTKPRQKATVEVVREFIYPTEFTMEKLPPGDAGAKSASKSGIDLLTPKTFEMMSLGLMLDIQAEWADDQVAAKSVTARLNEFDGFAKAGPAQMETDKAGVLRVKNPQSLPLEVASSASSASKSINAASQEMMKAANAKSPIGTNETRVPLFTTREWSGEATLKPGEWRLAPLEFKSGRNSAKPRHIMVLFSAEEATKEKESTNTEAAPATAPSETLLQKARGIILPSVEFQGASLPDAITFLRDKSRLFDPSKQGIDIFVRNDPPSTAKITLNLKDVPLNEALRYVSELSSMNLKWEPFAAVLTPIGEPEGMEMFVRVFRVPADLLGDAKEAKKWLENQSIHFPQGAEATFDATVGKLTVKNVPRELRSVESLLEGRGIKTVPPATPKPVSLQRADEIIFPVIRLRETTIVEAVEFLTTKSRELDPQKEGVPVTLVGDAARTANRLTLDLKEVPMGTALKYIATLAGLQLVAGESGVQLTATPPAEKALPFEVTSREAQSDSARGTYQAIGDVETEVAGFKIKAGKLSYDSKAGVIEITDTFELRTKTTITTSKAPSSRATINVKTGVLTIDGPVSTQTGQ